MLILIPYCNIAIFYDIVHLWTIDWDLYLDIHMQMCVHSNTDLICGFFFYFLMLVTISLRKCQLFIIASDKSQFI